MIEQNAETTLDAACRFVTSVTSSALIRYYDVTIVPSAVELKDMCSSVDAATNPSLADENHFLIGGGDQEMLGAAIRDTAGAAGLVGRDMDRFGVAIAKTALKLCLAAARHRLQASPADAAVQLVAMMMACPLNYHWWNARKRLLSEDMPRLALITEINVTNLIIATHPKTPEAWDHRRYLWERVLSRRRPEHHGLADNVLQLDTKHLLVESLRRHPRCYPAWEYRRFVTTSPTIHPDDDVVGRLELLSAEVTELLQHLDTYPEEATAAWQVGLHLDETVKLTSMMGRVHPVAERLLDHCLTCSTRQLMRCARLVADCAPHGSEQAHEAPWTLRRGVVSALLRLRTRLCADALWRGWTVRDELWLVETHVDAFPSRDDGMATNGAPTPDLLVKLRSRSTSPCLWPLWASRYGAWLCEHATIRATAALASLPVLTLFAREEVARHCTAEDLWIIIEERVYDVTRFAEEHPGDLVPLLDVAGQDATSDFDGVGHSSRARLLLPRFCIGCVAAEE